MVDLIDRERELAALDGAAAARGGQLAVVWGRRRVGKTYLLEAFSRQRRSVYYTATAQSAPVELAAFTDAVREQLGADGLPPGYAFPDWSTALDFLAERSGKERLVVVLDEFSYLAGSSPGLESVLQRWWDQRGKRSRLMLVLCGSAVAYMTAIGSAAAPLHQRATLSLYVPPLDYRAAGRFVERLKPAERAVVYAVCGGTPLYLEQWDDGADLRANLVRLFGSPAAPMVDAAELVLSGELPEGEGHFRILTAVALGRTRPGEIADYARVAVERPLKRLTSLGILERRVPALDDPDKSRRAIYRIADPYFAFWFRFIGAHRADIARGLGGQLIERRILPGLDDYLGPVFEDIAREHARHLAASGELDADRVEGWWSSDGRFEIDLVGLSGGDITFVGEAKWSQRAIRRDVLTRLGIHRQGLGRPLASPLRLLYGRTGCLEEVRSERNVRCFSAADLYA
jgi:AAA+ ATPase superfamily predicted ATPase